MELDEKWIRAHLPEDCREEPIDCISLGGPGSRTAILPSCSITHPGVVPHVLCKTKESEGTRACFLCCSVISAAPNACACFTTSSNTVLSKPSFLSKYAASLKAGKPILVEKNRTIADALVTQIPGSICFPHVVAHADGFADVDEEHILKGMKLLLTEGKLLCEPSSGISIGAVLQGLIPVKPVDKVCFFISGGSVSLEQLHQLESIEIEHL